MKRIIYIMAIFLLASIASNAQYTKRVVITSGDFEHKMATKIVNNEMVVSTVPNETIMATSPIGKQNNFDFLLIEDVQDVWTPFMTRLHPYPTETNKLDTARILQSVTDATDAGKWFIGDRMIPGEVKDAQGNTIFTQNGFAQIVPSMSYYYPTCKGGEFTIDTVRFLTYNAEPAGSPTPHPLAQDYIFTMIGMNVPKIGTSTFPGMAPIDFGKLSDGITEAVQVSATEMNARLTGNTINPLILTTEQMPTVSKYKSDSTFGIFFFKSNGADLLDKVFLIGAWEWGLKPNERVANCFGAAINHYPNGKDTISLSSNLYWPASFVNTQKVEYPAFGKLANTSGPTAGGIDLRFNLNFTLFGTYTGPINTDVKEVEAGSDMFSLSQNYPNPVMNNTNIRFSTKEFSRVTLNLYNSVGQLVHMLVAKDYMPGTYDVDFNTVDLQAGTYFYTLTVGSFSKTLPMTIAR